MNFEYDFKLDRFQEKAVSSIRSERSVLVAAPTSSGKTVIAEAAIASAISLGKRVFYTAPTKALCNQKFHDLSQKFGLEKLGLVTGDNSVSPWATVVVMTTEVLRNMLYRESKEITNLGWVVLDEVHFLEDPYRGAVWEEVVLNLSSTARIVALSATVSNVQELGDWFEMVHGPTDVVVESQRPVPLRTHYLVTQKQKRHNLKRVPLFLGKRVNPEGKNYDIRGQRTYQKRRWARPRQIEVVKELRRSNMLPVIFFVFSRKGCDESRNALLRSGINLNSDEELAIVNEITLPKLENISKRDFDALGGRQWIEGLRKGLASHHAGLVPLFKEITEELFVNGLLKVIYATETLAVGVNLPARSVVIEKLTKFNGQNHEMLTPGQFTQLTGRAGRRGIDAEGDALIFWSPFIEFGEVADLASSKDFILRSAFRPTYNMVANLIATRGRNEAEDLLSRSFAQFQISQLRTEKTSKDLLEAFEARFKVLESRGVVEGWSLTPKGKPLTHIFNEVDLLILECLQQEVFEDLSPADLASVISCMTFRRRGPEISIQSFTNKRVEKRVNEILQLAEDIADNERCFGIEPNESPDWGFADPVHDWVAGEELDSVLSKGLSGGEFVRNVRLIVDLLEQVKNVCSSDTANSANKAIGSLERGIVETSSVFGETKSMKAVQ